MKQMFGVLNLETYLRKRRGETTQLHSTCNINEKKQVNFEWGGEAAKTYILLQF